MMNIFKSKYSGIEYGIEYFKCKDYLADGSKLQKIAIANANDDDNTNDPKSCIQYCQQSHKQYDLLSLFICDNPANNDKESDDVTIKFIIAHGDTNSILLTWFMYEVSVIEESVTQDVPSSNA